MSTLMYINLPILILYCDGSEELINVASLKKCSIVADKRVSMISMLSSFPVTAHQRTTDH
jgi:hypothetical protein